MQQPFNTALLQSPKPLTQQDRIAEKIIKSRRTAWWASLKLRLQSKTRARPTIDTLIAPKTSA